MSKTKPKLTIMVSSTVYGIEELLERVYTLLTKFGYVVWMSHKGTLPVHSNKTAFENCLDAVEKCDLFLGIITPNYGSGLDKKYAPGTPSIFHREVGRSTELNRPRWMLAHEQVVFTRLLLNSLGYKGKDGRSKLTGISRPIDLRVLDIYEEAIVDRELVKVSEREGNWVQKFNTTEDGSLFVTAQFFRYQEVEKFIEENFANGSPLSLKGGKA